jgi:hypothetical protein
MACTPRPGREQCHRCDAAAITDDAPVHPMKLRAPFASSRLDSRAARPMAVPGPTERKRP